MKNEGLLPELARALREEDAESRARWDERWDRLAAGTLSAEEEAELAAMARTDPEARAAYEAFRPLGEGFQARVVAAIRERQEAAKQVAEPAPAPAPRRKEREATPWWRGRPLWAGLGGLATAGAAVALMVLVRPVAPIPPFSSEVPSGTRETRADVPEAPSTFRPGDPLRIRPTPDTTVADGSNLVARVYLMRGTSFFPVDVEAQVDESGAMELLGKLPDEMAVGPWHLWIVVGRPRKLPPPDTIRALSVDAAHHDSFWFAEPKVIEILRPPT